MTFYRCLLQLSADYALIAFILDMLVEQYQKNVIPKSQLKEYIEEIKRQNSANQGAFSTINRLFVSSILIMTFSFSLKGNRLSRARSTGRYRKNRSYSFPLALLMRLMIRPNPIDTIFCSLFATIILNPLIFFVMFSFTLPSFGVN